MANRVELADKSGAAIDSSNPLPVAGGTGASAGQTQGTAAHGAAAVGSPVQVAGKYDTAYGTLDSGDVGVLRLTAAGSLIVEPAGNVAAGVADAGNPIKVGGKYNSTLPTLTDGQRGDVQLYSRGQVVTIATGWNAIPQYIYDVGALGDAGGQFQASAVASYGLVWNGATFDRQPGNTIGTFTIAKGATSGGLSMSRVVTGTNGVIKNGAGQLYALASVRNANAAVRYLQIYDKATAGTLSTDTPVLTITLAASSVLNNIDLTNIGAAFANGISWQFTTDNPAIPTTAGASTEIMFTALYK